MRASGRAVRLQQWRQQYLSGGEGEISHLQELVCTPGVSSALPGTAGHSGSHTEIEKGDRDKGAGCCMVLVGTFSP